MEKKLCIGIIEHNCYRGNITLFFVECYICWKLSTCFATINSFKLANFATYSKYHNFEVWRFFSQLEWLYDDTCHHQRNFCYSSALFTNHSLDQRMPSLVSKMYFNLILLHCLDIWWHICMHLNILRPKRERLRKD